MLQQLYLDYQQQLENQLSLPSSTEEQLVLFDEIKQHLNQSIYKGESEKAEIWHALAWAIAYQTEDDDQIALAHWCSGIFYSERDISRSLDHQQKAVVHFQATEQAELEGRALIGYASQLSALGRIDQAEAAINRSIDCLTVVPDYRDWPMIYINLAFLSISKGDYPQAIEATQAAEKKAITLANHYPQNKAHYDSYRIQALINRGGAETLNGQMDSALESFQLALEMCQLDPEQTIYFMGLVYLNLARVANLRGELFAALHHLRDARHSFEQAEMETSQALVRLHAAEIYQCLMMPSRAVEAAQEAAASFTNAGLATDAVEAYLITVETILDQGRRKSAANKYLAHAEPLLGYVSQHLKALWKVYSAHPRLQPEEQYPQALQQTEQAIETLTTLDSPQYTLQARLVAAELADHLKRNDVVSRYRTIAKEAKKQGFVHIELSAYVGLAGQQTAEDAQRTLRQAANILVKTRQAMPVEELKANLLTGQMDIYAKLIEALLQSKDEATATQTLLEAKGAIWNELVQKQVQSSPDPAWIHARAELNYWQEERLLTEQQNDEQNVSYLELCRQKVQQAKEELQDTLRTADQASEVQIADRLPNPAEIQSQISENSIMLDYLIGSEQVYVCLISSAQEPEWLELGQVAELKSIMHKLSRQLKSLENFKGVQARYQSAQKRITQDRTIFEDLYDQLFRPVQERLDERGLTVDMLHIAPDQWLYSVPWSALYDSQSYLGQKYPISLYPSACALASDVEHAAGESTDPADEVVRSEIVLLGHPGHDPDKRLHYIKNELTQIQQIIPDAEVFYPATTANYGHQQKPICIHLAVHGHFESKTPLLSGLEMDDGDFLLADVFQLDLHGTELVNLSACETGVAPEQGGVVLALSGAFLCSGAKSVIASQWKVDDEATPKLMTSFYRAWRDGHTIAKALQQAQADVRAYNEHPFYWAAFQPLSRCK